MCGKKNIWSLNCQKLFITLLLELFSLEISLIVENAQNDLQASQTERLTELRTTKLDSFTRYLTQFPSKSQQKSFFAELKVL